MGQGSLDHGVTCACRAHLDHSQTVQFDLAWKVLHDRVIAQLGPAQRQGFVFADLPHVTAPRFDDQNSIGAAPETEMFDASGGAILRALPK